MRSLPTGLLERFRPLPLAERLHVRARAFSAPLGKLIAHVPSGRLLDLGCGHGLFCAWVALERPDVEVLGVDIDPRKIRYAQRALANVPNARVEEVSLEGLRTRTEPPFDAVALVDVLYLLPRPRRGEFLEQVHRLLRPGGLLLLKEVEGDHSWRHYKGILQEWAMVRLLRRTRTSGGLTLETRQGLNQLLVQAGFGVEEVADLRAGYTTAHLLHVARARP
jgi:2-polyprenyl-6-hydroxyphenyl methylase/3-demethylubiquinone-9 3-methyltransferase